MRNPAIALLLTPALLFGAYQYQFSDPLTSIDTNRWTVYGTPTTTPTGLTGSSSLISRVGSTDGTADFEIKTQIYLNASGGIYVHYLRATPTPNVFPLTGSMYLVKLSPAFASGACTASLNVTKRISPTDTILGTTTVPCHDGMTMRSFIRNTTIVVLIDDISYLTVWDGGIRSFLFTALMSGSPPRPQPQNEARWDSPRALVRDPGSFNSSRLPARRLGSRGSNSRKARQPSAR